MMRRMRKMKSNQVQEDCYLEPSLTTERKTKREMEKKRKWMNQRTKRQKRKKLQKLQRNLLMTRLTMIKRQQKKMMISRQLKEEYCLEHSSTIWRNLIKQTEKLQRMTRRRTQRLKIQKLQTLTRSKQFVSLKSTNYFILPVYVNDHEKCTKILIK